jgi:tetratricopeptide (TPR) repeat protein
MGVVLKALGDYDRALRYYERSVELNPGYHYAYLNMSAIYIERGSFREAIEILTKGIGANPGAHDLYYNRACSLAILEENEEAMDDIEISLQMHPQLMEWVLWDKDFDSIREEDRFKGIIEKYNLTKGKEEADDNGQNQ